MEEKAVAIDLFCRKGGATRGAQRSGLYVIGVDKDPQPGYIGDEFVQMDAIEFIKNYLAAYRPKIVLSSPPCQEGNAANIGTNAVNGNNHPQLVPPTREALIATGIPFVIEQPASSRKGLIRRDLTLCMDMFKGDMPPPWIMKHRSFELHGFTVPQPVHPAGKVRGHAGYVRGWRHGIERLGAEAPYVAAYGDGGGKAKAWEIAHASRIDWMTRPGMTKAEEKAARFDLCESIPPDFMEYITRHARIALGF